MITPKIHLKISAESEILFISANQNYSVFHLDIGSKLVSAYTLKFHQDQLCNDDYLRVNRSMLIHKNFVSDIKEKKNGYYVILKNGNNILISRRRVKAIQEQYLNA